ncbi:MULTISPECIES: DUF5017 domain-containing protein [unclassified Sphingobacterium]|uniref:DUF5017 domain-containing protein n=1 Tax=unclassified Sphingobacterium TaxID=2609468 RepID=UPI0025E2E3B1|nr:MULTISPECIES: DUF5017 domain-containing protein [unclassified Sphingobacterium]
MKRSIKLFLFLALYSLQSCEKKEVTPLHLEIGTAKSSYKVDEPVVFQIGGNPDQLTFYSGEEGHKYSYRERTKAVPMAVTVEFASNRRYGTDAQQPRSLRLLVSQRFSGIYQADAIVESEWVDITPAFNLSGIQSSDAVYLPSGRVDLFKLSNLGFTIDPNALVYFAFKYTGSTGSTQPRWWINLFNLNTLTTEGVTLPIATLQGAEWRSIGLQGSSVSWLLSSSGLRFQGGGAAISSNLVWAVSKPLDLTSVTPDKGVALKNMSTRINSYAYIFRTPGNYEVTFVGNNVNAYGENPVTKTIQLTITE